MSVSESARAPRLLRYPRRLKLVAIITVLLFAAALVVAGLSAWRQDNLTQSLREDTAGWSINSTAMPCNCSIICWPTRGADYRLPPRMPQSSLRIAL